MVDFTIPLLAHVEDKITGFAGVVTGRAEYATGCRQYSVQPPVKNGEYRSGVWLDEDRLVQLPDTQPESVPVRNAGGPQQNQPSKS